MPPMDRLTLDQLFTDMRWCSKGRSDCALEAESTLRPVLLSLKNLMCLREQSHDGRTIALKERTSGVEV